MKLYRRHRCEKQHRNPRTFLQCAIRGTAWVEGTGEYALIAWCGQPKVTLWQSPTLAQAMLAELNAVRCGGRCRGRHEIVRILVASEKEIRTCQKPDPP